MATEVEMYVFGLYSPDGVVKEVYTSRNPSQSLGSKKYDVRHHSRRGEVLQWMNQVGPENINYIVFEKLDTVDLSVRNERKQYYRKIYVEGGKRVDVEAQPKPRNAGRPKKEVVGKPEPFYTQIPTVYPRNSDKAPKPIKAPKPQFSLDEQYATACELFHTLDGRYMAYCLSKGEMDPLTMGVNMALNQARSRMKSLKEQIEKRDGVWVSPEEHLKNWQERLQINENTHLSEDISYDELADHLNDRRICKDMIKHFTYLTQKAAA